MRNRFVVLVAFSLLVSVAWAQQTQNTAPTGQQSMPGMDMSGMKDMKGMPAAADKDKDTDSGGDNDSDASVHAMHSMEGHMDMGPHMKMTALRPSKPGDADRAQQIVESARKASEKYTDYHTALADGFKIFHPEVPAEDVSLHQLRVRHGSGLSLSILSIRRRCSMKSMAKTTN